MSDKSEGSGKPVSVVASEDPDPPSTAKLSFFDRLFGTGAKPQAGKSEERTSFPGIASGAQEMLVNLRNMHNQHVEDVYVPKADIVAASEDADSSHTACCTHP